MSSTLFAWIGLNDIKAANGQSSDQPGPIAKALKDLNFDEIYLLSNLPEGSSQHYQSWLASQTKAKTQLLPIHLTSPTAYGEIYSAVRSTLQNHCSKVLGKTNLTFHLSPGTPAMAAIWLILAKTVFPAQLIETSLESGTKIIDFPFDIAADFLPDHFRRQDEALLQIVQGASPDTAAFESIIHECPAMTRLIVRSRLVAPRNVPVHLQGESGTGKELLARAIHQTSGQSSGPFIAVNCGAIPIELVDAELFGHTKGAFTGAAQPRAGYFEAANGGTLFLDEIGELPLSSQVKLLRVLQERKVTRIGATQPIALNVRIISATNRDLPSEVRSKRFREDLYHRLAVAILVVPPLRERGRDLNLLIDSLFSKVLHELELDKHKKISVGARKILIKHDWPGNVRELQNTLARAALWSETNTILPTDIDLPINPHMQTNFSQDTNIEEGVDLRKIMQEMAGSYLKSAMEATGGNKTRAANLLGLSSYQTLTNWMKKQELI